MPIDGCIAGAGAASGLYLLATASVVNNKADTEAAFCKAEREVTFVGSAIPASNHVYIPPLAALNPIPKSFFSLSTQSLIGFIASIFSDLTDWFFIANDNRLVPVATSPSASSAATLTNYIDRCGTTTETMPANAAARVCV